MTDMARVVLSESRLRAVIAEAVRDVLQEAFRSDRLRQWFRMHGGVAKMCGDEGFPESRKLQDGLGDVDDGQIVYMEEFASANDAIWARHRLLAKNGRRRSDWDMAAFFVIYQANDGKCLLVGLDRKKVQTYHTWGGERTKKKAARVLRDEHHPEYKGEDGYFDPKKQMYHYSKMLGDVGVKDNEEFGKMKSDNAKKRSRMSPEDFGEYLQGEIGRKDAYFRRHYGKGMRSRDPKRV